MRTIRIASILLAVALFAGCGNDSAPTTGGDPGGNVTIAFQLPGGTKLLSAVAYSIFSTPPPDVATFAPSAAGGCAKTGSAGAETVNSSCLPHDGSPVYVNGVGNAPASDISAQLQGSNTTFDYNISLANGSGYTLAVGGVSDDGTSFCYGYTPTTFAIASGMKTTVNITITCIVPGTTSGFLNTNATIQSAVQPSIVSFMTGPMSATAISGSAGQVVFTVNANDGGGDFVNFHFNNVANGTWVSSTHDCDETTATGVGSNASCTVTYQCPSTGPTTQDITVEVFNTGSMEAAESLSSPAPISDITLDFGSVSCN